MMFLLKMDFTEALNAMRMINVWMYLRKVHGAVGGSPESSAPADGSSGSPPAGIFF